MKVISKLLARSVVQKEKKSKANLSFLFLAVKVFLLAWQAETLTLLPPVAQNFFPQAVIGYLIGTITSEQFHHILSINSTKLLDVQNMLQPGKQAAIPLLNNLL